MKRIFLIGSVLISTLFLNACTLAYKTTGNVMTSYAEDHGVSYMLANDDVALSCSMAESFTPFLLSFSEVTTSPDKLAVLFYLMAGNCAEFEAWEEELRFIRALHVKNSVEARDARIAQQRLLSLAARRQLTGYSYLSKAYSEPGGECPEFDTDDDELFWLVGLISGLQAVINDLASAASEGVPMDIAAKVGRGAACLNNEKWWGAPAAIQAAIWMSIPGSEAKDKKPEAQLKQSMQTAKQQGIKIPLVLAAQVYMGQGDESRVKQIIRDSVQSIPATEFSRLYKSLNQISNLQLQAISDRLWTQATGSRTPIGKLGSFWDDVQQNVETIDIDDIL